MAQAAMIANQLLQVARDNKLASRGLGSLSKKTKNRFLRGILSGGSKVAGALGFANAMDDSLVPYGPQNRARSRAGGSKRTRARRRRRAAGASSGASTAGAANAPVAFARTDKLMPLFKVAPSDSQDGMLVHAVELVGPVTMAAAGAFNVTVFQKNGPQNTALFPWLSTFAPLFQRYKLKMLKIHYQHFVSTAQAGQVMLQFFPDPSFNNSVSTGLTQAIVTECSNFMTGACYEDFCHTADLTGLDQSQWLDTQTSSPTDDVNPNWAGIVAVYTMNGTNVAIGNIWLEAVFEFKGRSSSSVTVGLSKLREAIVCVGPRERRIRLAASIAADLVDAVDERRKEKPQVDALAALEKQYSGVYPTPGLTSVPALTRAT